MEILNEEIDYPTDGEPHSEVEVAFELRKSHNYSSASMRVGMRVPCNPGEESKAIDVLVERADAVLMKYEDDFKRTVRDLGR